MPVRVIDYDGTVEGALTLFYSMCGQNGLSLEWGTAYAIELGKRLDVKGLVQDVKAGRV